MRPVICKTHFYESLWFKPNILDFENVIVCWNLYVIDEDVFWPIWPYHILGIHNLYPNRNQFPLIYRLSTDLNSQYLSILTCESWDEILFKGEDCNNPNF
jgi:hypothetical protein